MESKGYIYFRYIFSVAFALGATASLFVLLEFLVTTQLPLKTTALNPTTNIKIRRITVTPKSSQKPQHKSIASNSKAEKIQTQQQIIPQTIVKISIPDKQLSSIVKTKAVETKSIKARPVKAQSVKTKAANDESIKSTLANIQVDSKPDKPKAVKETIRLAENTNMMLAPVLDNTKAVQTSIPQSRTENTETDIHNTKIYAPTMVDAKELKKVYSPNPSYPRKAQRRNIQGWVMTNFQIRTDGSVAQIEIIDGKNAIFFKNEVIKTLESWIFEKDQSQQIKASMRFVFSLRS